MASTTAASVSTLTTNTMTCSYSFDYCGAIAYNHGNDTASANGAAQHHTTP